MSSNPDNGSRGGAQNGLIATSPSLLLNLQHTWPVYLSRIECLSSRVIRRGQPDAEWFSASIDDE
ncbi:hypothetical protein CTA1_6892 [Colletotrichum tanaceti]|uniref:Uncharacterized protein n=1 Tax=Colletotrichum tanaceti TaxID=1306861 RepID=A0A4U6XM63_9PEZI|nr:hypothetical protein CTA1_6892 [Colletotrichum tanaceti]